jgi:hypothetical protein
MPRPSPHDERALLREYRKDVERAVLARDADKFRRVLRKLDIDPSSAIGKKRMAAFYRSCDMDDPDES